ncbi:hypothetical protein FISHEDRAFT_71975 [Fistulina hepatica ATCC 64428]|uniref:YCII-related domain-containing protein n=1 Tax=Fistulina hepatica ATCC 64428 TaxID=1128425 RepID=A0A0D7AG22_9AGAR|nr:hypothetical protein FISHEDRAFT_71975 [Fistulina hepatica ATCC 64428]
MVAPSRWSRLPPPPPPRTRRSAAHFRSLFCLAFLARSTGVGGMMVTPETMMCEPTDRVPVGSTLIVEAASIEEVKEKIAEDVYWQSGVWDKEKMVILPIFLATQLP